MINESSLGVKPGPYQQVMPVTEAGGSHVINPTDNTPDSSTQVAIQSDVPLSQEDQDRLVNLALELVQRKKDAEFTLARSVEGKLSKRMGTRKNKENQWLESMRLYLGSLSSYNIVTGEYPFGTKDDYSTAGQNIHRPEFNIIRQKCNIAIAQCVAHQFAAGDKNWNLRIPQVIDIDQDDVQAIIQQSGNPNLTPQDVAQIKCDLMEREIDYHLELTRYPKECRLAIADRVILGTGIMKGPINCGQLKKIYTKQRTSNGQVIRIPSYTVETTPLIYRINPWYFFPDDSVTDIAKAEDAIEVHPMSKGELAELVNHPGYNPEEIAACLGEEPRQYTNSPFNDPAYLTQGINLLKNKYLVLEYHGPIKKEDLDILGLESNSPLDEVYGEIWVCNSRVIRLQLETLEGCNKLPYVASVWEPDPAMIFGFGIPMLARDQQRVVNESYKMILDNAGVSAGPQVIVDTTIIKPAVGGMECTPWKVWLANEYGADVTKAIQFFTPPNSFEELSSLLTLARGFADEESSINLLAAGGQTPAGAMDSATGLALQNENALTPIFYKSEQWDDEVTHPLIDFMYDWEMQYNPKDEIKGTFDIDVRSTTALLKGLMDQQKLDRLFQEIAQGSPVGEWINMDELIEARLAIMKLPFANIVKNPQQVQQTRAQQPPPQPDPNMLKAQAMLQQNQLDSQRLALDANRLQWEQQKHSADLQMQASIQADTNSAKIHQHELDVQKAAIQAKGASMNANNQASAAQGQIDSNLQAAIMANQTKKQIAGLKHVESQNKLMVEQQKISAQQRIAQAKQDQEMRQIRSNAVPKQEKYVNRNLSEHNPKPSKN